MITPLHKIGCDICGDAITKEIPKGAKAFLPDGWYETGYDIGGVSSGFCLKDVKIICGTCHGKLAALRKSILADAGCIREEDAEDAATESPRLTAKINGREAYMRHAGCAAHWRYTDSDEIVPSPDVLATEDDAPGKHSITSTLDGRDCYWDAPNKAWRWDDNNDVLPIPRHSETILPEFLATNTERKAPGA